MASKEFGLESVAWRKVFKKLQVVITEIPSPASIPYPTSTVLSKQIPVLFR